uniref:Uncharacterized protein n=1 Tax=Arundo donax TaxID=35708 RepID=A0A0A9GQT9_ARUDO
MIKQLRVVRPPRRYASVHTPRPESPASTGRAPVPAPAGRRRRAPCRRRS